MTNIKAPDHQTASSLTMQDVHARLMTTIDSPDRPTALESATYDAQQAAVRVGCSVRHIRRMIDDGKLPGVIRIGRLVRISRRELDRFLAGESK